MKLSVFAFGKLKTPGLRESADYYGKLIGSFASFQEIELKPQVVPEKGRATRLKIQQQEGKALLEKLEPTLGSRGQFYLLDETGKAQTTKAWSELITRWEDESVPAVALCIGSSLGFSAELRPKARGLLSLGPQTLPHELARVVLLEQLYRALALKNGHPYHNEGSS